MNWRETVENTVKTEDTYRIKRASIYIIFLNYFLKRGHFHICLLVKADSDASYYLDTTMYHDSFSKQHQL